MEPIDVYLLYCALKAHFGDGNYDYFKYEGKTRIKRDSFYKRKDRFFFVKLSRKKEYQDIKNYLVANFVSNPDGYVARFDDKTYEDWLYRKQNFYTIFTDEMRPLVKDFEPLFIVKSNNHPKLLQEYLGKRVSLETLIILNQMLRYDKKWDKQLLGDFIWNDVKKLMKNYQGFLTINDQRYRIQLLKLIEEGSYVRK
jgi:hypothetical protein